MDDGNKIRDAQDAGNRLIGAQLPEDPFSAAFKATRMPILITDPRQDDNPIIFSNQAFSKLTGYSREGSLAELSPPSRQGYRSAGGSGDQGRCSRGTRSIGRHPQLSHGRERVLECPLRQPGERRKGEVIYFFASQLDFTDIKSKEAELARARHIAEEEVARRTADLTETLRVKTALVHEVDHRVKNNLLTIASIMKLQARLSTDETVKRTVGSMLNRVEALSTVQRKMLNDDDVGHFDVADFTCDIVGDLVNSLKRPDIKLTTDLHEGVVPATKASPLAIIVNELVGDAVRRGLSDGGGEIHVEVRRLNKHFLIRVADTVTPVEVDKEDEAFAKSMLDAALRQLRAKIGRSVEGHRTEVKVTLQVGD